MKKIRIQNTEHFVRITLDDPPLNILDIPMLEELRDALESIAGDRTILVIDAAGGRAFSAGASVQDHLGDRVKTMLATFHACFRILARTEMISVCLVNGAALGGGCELALAADFVLASTRAKFGQPEISLGVFPPIAAMQLSRQLPPRIGLELLLTGRSIDAETAGSLGLVNAVFPAEEFESKAWEWLGQLTKHSTAALRHARRAFRLGMPDEFESRLQKIEALYLDELMKTDDALEGLNAFIEKRAPVWTGR